LLATCLVLVGLVLRRRLSRVVAGPLALPALRSTTDRGLVESSIAAACSCLVVIASILLLVGAFRTPPWLDDSWTFWIPKGLILGDLGLDHRLFTPNAHFLPLTHRAYPLLWSITAELPIRFVGHVDLRAATG